MGKGDSRLHARTQADADTMAAKWDQTFGAQSSRNGEAQKSGNGETQSAPLTDAERDAMWRADTHIQRGRDK